MGKDAKILVVDDDSGVGEMLKTLLEFYSFEVVVSEKPDETEKLISQHKIDLVLLDMLISGVNGTDVCARLRQNEEMKDIPVLMMSALHDAGANDFIAKPFEMDDLIVKINEVLENRP